MLERNAEFAVPALKNQQMKEKVERIKTLSSTKDGGKAKLLKRLNKIYEIADEMLQ